MKRLSSVLATFLTACCGTALGAQGAPGETILQQGFEDYTVDASDHQGNPDEVGGRFGPDQIFKQNNVGPKQFKNVKDGCYWVELRDDNKLTYNLVEVDQFELKRVNVTHRE